MSRMTQIDGLRPCRHCHTRVSVEAAWCVSCGCTQPVLPLAERRAGALVVTMMTALAAGIVLLLILGGV